MRYELSYIQMSMTMNDDFVVLMIMKFMDLKKHITRNYLR